MVQEHSVKWRACGLVAVVALVADCALPGLLGACALVGVVQAWYCAHVIPEYTRYRVRRWICIGWMATFGLWGIFATFPLFFLVQFISGSSAPEAIIDETGYAAVAALCAGIFTSVVIGWAFRSYWLSILVVVATLAAAGLLALAGDSLWYLLAMPAAIMLWNLTLITAISDRFARRRFPPHANECGRCGYCTLGLPTNVCPECGMTVGEIG